MKKARVKATGKIVEIVSCRVQGLPGGKTLFYNVTKEGDEYLDDSLDFNYKNNPDYWTRLEHQAAIAAMLGFMVNGMGDNYENIAKFSITQAHTLVEKYKKEKK